MIVLSFDVEVTTRIVNGEQPVVTYPEDHFTIEDDPRQQVRLESVTMAWHLLVGQPVAIARYAPEPFYPDSGGAIVGSATVAAVVPIHDNLDTDRPLPYIWKTPRSVLMMLHAPEGGNRDLTDQLSFADFTPGRYAVILTDAAPCEQRCPTCRGDGLHPTDDYIGCSQCDGDATCAPIPYSASGPISEWTP